MDKKKLTSLTVALAVTASLFAGVTVQAEQRYSDVGEGHWAYQWVEHMDEKGYIHGYPDGTYQPDEYITRAEYVTILNYMFDSQGTTDKNYIDVLEGDWYYGQIHAAVNAGYLHGYDDATEEHDGTMKPNNNITREEAAVVLACAYGLAKNTDVAKFSDADLISDWAVPYVGALAGGEVLMGDETGSFRPKDFMKRAEVASMIAQSEIHKGDLVFEEVVELPSEIGEADGVYTVGGITIKNIPEDKTFTVSVDVTTEGEVGTFKLGATKDSEELAKDADAEGLAAALKDKLFTGADLEKLSISVSDVVKPADGSSIKIVVKIMESGEEAKVVAEKEYVIVFKAEDEPSKPGGSGGSGGAMTGGGITVTDVSTTRDRVVESLKDYQDGLTNGSSATTIYKDKAYHNISNDMLKVILTNDGMITFDASVSQTKDAKNVESALTTLALAKSEYYNKLSFVYEDVVAFVLFNAAEFGLDYGTATVETANKDKYVYLFRAMVEIINGAADAAMTVYKDNAATAENEIELFEAFKVEAINETTYAMNKHLKDNGFANDEITAITLLATDYVDRLFFDNSSGYPGNETIMNGLASASADGEISIDEFASILDSII